MRRRQIALVFVVAQRWAVSIKFGWDISGRPHGSVFILVVPQTEVTYDSICSKAKLEANVSIDIVSQIVPTVIDNELVAVLGIQFPAVPSIVNSQQLCGQLSSPIRVSFSDIAPFLVEVGFEIVVGFWNRGASLARRNGRHRQSTIDKEFLMTFPNR